MNNASILAASLVLLVPGIILWRRSRRDKTITHRGGVVILLVILAAAGVIYQVVNFVMFMLFS